MFKWAPQYNALRWFKWLHLFILRAENIIKKTIFGHFMDLEFTVHCFVFFRLLFTEEKVQLAEFKTNFNVTVEN